MQIADCPASGGIPSVRRGTLRERTAVMTLAAVVICGPLFPQDIPSETWMSVYIGTAKVGYARSLIRTTTFEGKPAYQIDDLSKIKVIVMDVEVGQDMESTTILNEQFDPIRQVFKMSSAGHTTIVTAVYGPKEIVAEVESEGTKSTKTIPIPPGSKVLGEPLPFDAKLKVGDKFSARYFEPMSLKLDDAEIEVLRKERIKLEDKEYEALVVKSATSLGETTFWQDERGNSLKMATSLMGLTMTMVREPKEVAMGESYAPPADLAVITSCPASREIANPRQVKHMKVRLSGLKDKALAISDARQKVTLTGSTAEIEINARTFEGEGLSLPIKDHKELLAETPYIQSANPQIISTAREIVGDEKNAYKAVALLHDWVESSMETRGDIGVMRSAVDILGAKEGVCRDYAVLYTSLARAAGIPTKFVTGLIYFKGGFYYHAWAESFVGEWIPVDATLPGIFVDATHIKLAEGDTSAIFDAIKAVGNLKAEVVAFQ